MAFNYEISSSATVSDLNNPSNPGFQIDLSTIDNYSNLQSIFNFNGYFMVQSEIFEFDAIEYTYVATDDAYPYEWKKVWVESDADIPKYQYLAKTGFQDPLKPETAFFRPTGRIRIKNRAALGTSAQLHTVPGPNALFGWTERKVGWNI